MIMHPLRSIGSGNIVDRTRFVDCGLGRLVGTSIGLELSCRAFITQCTVIHRSFTYLFTYVQYLYHLTKF